ncbi:GDP-mannose 4,6-dehydratase [Microvirga aerophila]|uniref:GDP-6-deoxy-D-lyxo-4-hexulose reductase n=1 Tax=Microvirga aerophila TaxID=670291 RepID=A0A512BZ63_9HYPH|nr:GDP-mannose 4,6-dehydratase [Microvirga aerophila]GEO17254.1 GDP-6-deoxy-D-lyxo-4-hexulose reductase [Microvirga aerophila]
MRVLITGAHGFVGPYLAQALRRVCGDVTFFPTGTKAEEHSVLGPVSILDVTDPGAVSSAIRHFRPSHVVNLAGLAAPAAATADPRNAWQVHVEGVLNLAQAILEHEPSCWLLNAGSGLVYGESAKLGVPLNESTLLAPVDEYAVTKAAADLALGALARRGLKSIRFRPFNHFGPGQAETFVIPAFAMQIAQIEAGLAAPVIRVGNLDAERDFLDVRDVVDAYALAVRSADKQTPGIILNVASGVPRRIGDILGHLLAQSRVRIEVEQDPARLRPSDLPRIVGDADRARQKLDWTPSYSFDDTLVAVLDDCRSQVGRAA